ncbi:MAG: bifunctional pyr operon transcriptional regulator/uracil phosphoribosyltransferase PyrR [Erysipelotrichaceae bacterium]
MEQKEILDAAAMKRSLTRITYEIIERNKGTENLLLVGIKTRGAELAKHIQANIERLEGKEVECISLDISHWRDDLQQEYPLPDVQFSAEGKKVILVDDVLFKGRTVRAAMDAIMHYGRPKEIQLAVLVDRGHRELPIRADYIGKNIPSALEETIKVKVVNIDGVDGVYLWRG